MRTEKQQTLTATGLAILRRSETNSDGARLRGSGQQASARRLEALGLGRFADCRPAKSRFYISEAGRQCLAALADEARARVTAFRHAAHRRLVEDPRRGRLLLQLAYVADRDAERGGCHGARRLRALGDELAAAAARLGVTGGVEAAFGEVFARAEELSAPAEAREQLVALAAQALAVGAVLDVAGVTARLCGEVVRPWGVEPLYVVERDGAVVAGQQDDLGAAACFVGAQGAGEVGAAEALAHWEADPGPPSTVRVGWSAGQEASP